MTERVSGMLLVVVGLVAMGAQRGFPVTIGGVIVLATGLLMAFFGSGK